MFATAKLNVTWTPVRVGATVFELGTPNRKSDEFRHGEDYLRMELSGYVPPAPENVAAYAGNNRVLVCWALVPGAASYDVLRSTTADGKYVPISSNTIGPVCGSGPSRATFTDTTAVNGTTYYYTVQSVNSIGRSVNSLPASATPSAELAVGELPAPAGLTVAASDHHKVVLNWTASPGANYYSVWRTTLHVDGVGGSYPLRAILLDDATTGASYTDNSPTDGRDYSYHVTATCAAGTSVPSNPVTAKPLPPAPVTAPDSFVGKWTKTRDGQVITLSWSPVPGATGYVIYRTTGANTKFNWPDNFLTALVETTYVDKGNTEKNAKEKGLDKSLDYSYQVTAVNVAGISPSTIVHVTALK